MEPKNTYYIGLIHKYLCGEATADEIVELETWTLAHPDNGEHFRSYHKTWQALENDRIGNDTDMDAEWDSLKSKLSGSLSAPRTISRRIPRPASVILTWTFRIAAIALLLLIPVFLVYRAIGEPDIVQFAAQSQCEEYSLPDGTRITLNKGAILTCPSSFGVSSRNVTLTGEAFFEVAHDAGRPFTISAGDARIEVLGTTFTINTSAPGNMEEVILSAGKVKVYLDRDPVHPVFLLPGQKASIDQNSQTIRKEENGDVNFLAWKTRRLVFNNTGLAEVAAQLTKVYHLPVTIAGNGLNNCKITATFDKQPVESVLNVLKATLDLQIRKTGNGIELSGPGCN